jgi:hypothetical protein
VLGAKCDPQAMTDERAGVCIAITGGLSMCSSPCVLGGEVPNPLECFGPLNGVCLYSPAGSGAGDGGFCAQACTQQDQCQVPGFFCFGIGLDTAGACLNSTPCASDADCNFLDGACIERTLGKYCMSPEYPLGNL